MTNPAQSRDERLRDILATTVGICYGMGGYDERLVSFGSGFPGGSGGGGSKGTVSRPVEAQVIATVDEHRADPAKEAQAEFDKRLEAAQRALNALWESYAKVATPRLGSSKIVDPGCELCAVVPCGCDRCSAQDHRHYCDVAYTVEHEIPAKRKGQPPSVRKYRLCSNCYEFQRSDRAGRLPSHDEVLDHVEGRRRRWKVGA